MSNKYGVALGVYLDDHKIEAIKAWRRTFSTYDEHGNIVTTFGLREAKDEIERMMFGQTLEYELSDFQVITLRDAGFVLVQLTGKKPRRVTVYVKENQMDGRKIEAIKRLRRATGFMGLKEAKEFMDEMWRFNRPVEIHGCTELMHYRLVEEGFTVEGFLTEAFKDNEDLFVI